MNWLQLTKDVSRVLICLSIVLVWLYCSVNELSCKSYLEPYAITVLAAQLGIEGIIKIIDGLPAGKYNKAVE